MGTESTPSYRPFLPPNVLGVTQLLNTESGSESEVKFDGIDGVTCHEFIQAVRKYAFDEGHSNDNKWAAEIASFRFSGPALKWFEELDDATQEDWKLLKRALLHQYAEPSCDAARRGRSPLVTASSSPS